MSQENFLRVTSVAKPDLVMAEVAKMKAQVVTGLIFSTLFFLNFCFLFGSPFKIVNAKAAATKQLFSKMWI